LETLLSALQTGVPADRATELLAERAGLPPRSVARVLATLQARDALVLADRAPTARDADTLYDRQVRFFEIFGGGGATGSLLNERLQGRKVLIAGLGGYGSWIALLCSRIGIRTIVGLDHDKVELSNLSRQVLYRRADVGALKVEACRRMLREVDESIRFDGHAVRIGCPGDVEAYLQGVDFVFNPFGYIAPGTQGDTALEHVAIASLRAGLPSLVLGGSWIGPLTVPGRTACYWCLLSLSPVLDVVKASMPGRGARFTPSFAPRIAASTAVAVWEAARFLSGMDVAPTLHNVITLDLYGYRKQALLPVPINAECGLCGEYQKGRDGSPIYARPAPAAGKSDLIVQELQNRWF
jgi:hypothetical protein